MKKKILIPCLLLAGSLTACDSGLVSGGEPYKEGDTTKVSEALKAEKQDKVKTMSYKQTVDMSMKMTSGDEKASATGSATVKVDLNLDDKTVDVNYSMKAKSKDTSASYSATVKAKKEGNDFKVVDSKGDYAQIKDDLDFDTYFDVASTGAYCWNFSFETGDFNSALGEVDVAGGFADLGKFIDDIKKSTVIKGDVSQGTFDIGLSKEVTTNISMKSDELANLKMDFTFNKLKYSFKDCMLKSSIVGLKTKGDMTMSLLGQTVSIGYEYDITVKGEYSYSFK